MAKNTWVSLSTTDRAKPVGKKAAAPRRYTMSVKDVATTRKAGRRSVPVEKANAQRQRELEDTMTAQVARRSDEPADIKLGWIANRDLPNDSPGIVFEQADGRQRRFDSDEALFKGESPRPAKTEAPARGWSRQPREGDVQKKRDLFANIVHGKPTNPYEV